MGSSMNAGKALRAWTAVLATVLALGLAPCALAQSYRRGDEADEIGVIQQALTELDLYYADVTGHYGARTERAVRLFQRKYRLIQTGIADETTIRRLYEAAGIDAPSLPQKTQTVASVLRKGASGDAVRRLQADLEALDYYTGTITGSYGSLTKEAVRRFQRAHGLDADGVAGPLTLARIATELGRADEAAAQKTEDTAAPAAQPMLGNGKTLRRGSRSSAVTTLQKMLTALKYFDAAATGYYGSQTAAAVSAFQEKEGLTVDGVAGRMTIKALNERYAEQILREEQTTAAQSVD